MKDIKIGTLISVDNVEKVMPRLIEYGFETFSITFWETTKPWDLVKLSEQVKDILKGSECSISSVSIFGNPLSDSDKGIEARESWRRLIDLAHLFGTDLVTGFAGRVEGGSVEGSIAKYTEVYNELGLRAKDKGVRLAFENCPMGDSWNGGQWNIAINPKAWDLMFSAVKLDNIGLQWEPCHQMCQLIDPIPQLRKWVHKIFSVHGKDATVAWDIVKEDGILGTNQFAWHRTPGFGDSNWTDIISILRMNNFKGSIDIEGFHDPVYRDELEYTGQVHGLNYLKNCRGGDTLINLDHAPVRI